MWQWEAGRFVDLTTRLWFGLGESGLATLVDANQAVFAGSDGRIGVLDIDRRQLEHIRVSRAFLPDVMRGLDGGLMVCDMSGLSRLDWPPRWRSFSDTTDAPTRVFYTALGNGWTSWRKLERRVPRRLTTLRSAPNPCN